MTMLKTGQGAGNGERGTGNVLFLAAARVEPGRQGKRSSGLPFPVPRSPFPACLLSDITRFSARSQQA
jgi:hypothetical protein